MWLRAFALGLSLTMGCALFGGASEVVPAVMTVIGQLAKLAKEKTGKDLKDLPFTCEHEQVPPSDGKPGQLLMLCTVILEEPHEQNAAN